MNNLQNQLFENPNFLILKCSCWSSKVHKGTVLSKVARWWLVLVDISMMTLLEFHSVQAKFNRLFYSNEVHRRIIFISCNTFSCRVDCPKNVFSSQTEIFTLGTTFSHSLGQKQFRKVKVKFFHPFFKPAQAVQSFTT